MTLPGFPGDDAFRALRSGELDTDHRLIAGREVVDFENVDLPGTDLREADLAKVNLRGADLRDADLWGVDLRHLDLEGCSLLRATISGTFFPESLSAEEIRLSHDHGTRLRPRR
jgi:uncharacterized protein YjbI with pentapeptide repeats